MEIIKYTEEWKEKWDEFVLNSNNGTMFHMQKFFDYHKPGRFPFHHLIFLEKGNIIAVLPGKLINGFFESPVGASYGSIVTGDERFKTYMDIVSCFLDYAKKENYKEVMLTPAPLIYDKFPDQSLEYALLWQGFSYKTHYISSAIKLDTERDLIQRFKPTARRNVRKTLKNDDIRVEINERYDQFYPILLDNKSKHNAKPTHSLDELYKLNELMPGYLKLFMVYYKDKPIGGSSMFFPNKQVALCFYNMLLYDYDQYKPIQRVMYEVVQWCTDEGYSYVDIGVSQDTTADDPMTPSMSLIDFKEHFDAKAIMRNTLYKKI